MPGRRLRAAHVPPLCSLADGEDGGWEGATGPQVCASGLSSDDEEPTAAAAEALYGAASCPLPTVCPMPGEVERQL